MYSESNMDFYTKAGYKLHYKIVKDTGKMPLAALADKTKMHNSN